MLSSRAAKIIVFVLCSSFVISIIPRSLNNKVKADTHINYSGEKQSSDCSYRSVEKASFTAEVKTTNKWSGHSNIEIKFKNTGTETIHDWYFTFDFNYKIENPFNCRVIESKDNLYTIGNNDWNQDIQPGKTVTIGFTAASKDGSDINDMPTFYLLNTETVTLKSGDLTYKYEEYSNWSSGFNGTLILTNKTKETIKDWTITFGANRPITQADSSVFTDNSDGTYTITNDGNNQNIAKGQSYRIGIQGGANNPSKAFELTDFTATAKKMALKLTDDKDKNGIADVLEVDFNGTVTVTPTQTPTSTPTATNTPTATVTPTATHSATTKPIATNTPTSTNKPTSTPTATITPTKKPTTSSTPTAKPTVTSTPTVTPKPTISATPVPTISSTPTSTPVVSVTPTTTITVTPTPTAMPTGFSDDIDYGKDTDKDGLPDDLEDYYGTDKNKKDTDGDGVNDYFELMLETDPLTSDSNGSNDFDNDGLTNAKESQLGTNPKTGDSDLDGLTDGSEVNLYGTDPKKCDTDDDGISDSGEISLGSNPNKKDSDILRRQTLTFYPKADSKLKGITKVEVSGYISGHIEENTKIRDISDSDPQTASIEALIGVPVDIETTGDFDSMTIKFYYEEGDFEEDDLRVLWYDEENCQYVMFDVEDSRINYDENYFFVYTDHFSKYMLIDQGAWVKTWANGMRQAGGTSALRNNYTLDGYRWDMERLQDSDKDGLPDVLEINGMITSTGKVIRTDPNNPDSDDDTILDGEEMGELCLTNKVFEHGTFEYFNRYWTAEYGYRYFEYVYFCMKSDPTKKDSDGDGVTDDVDKTPNQKNRKINYIFLGKDHTFNNAIGYLIDPYIWTFEKLDEPVEVLSFYNGSDYQRRFEDFLEASSGKRISVPPCLLLTKTFNVLLNCDLGAERIENKQCYSGVDKLIIIAHGQGSHIEFDPDDDNAGQLTIKDIRDINPACNINIMDIQACFCGLLHQENSSEPYPSVAREFAKKDKIDKVYAWTGEASSDCFYSKTILDRWYYNYSINGKYVVYRMKEGIMTVSEVKAKNRIRNGVDENGNPIYIYLYAPLEY